MKSRLLVLGAVVTLSLGLGGWQAASSAAAKPQATITSLEASVVSLQRQVAALRQQVSSLQVRIGSGPAIPNISVLLDQVTAAVNCFRQSEGTDWGTVSC